MESYKSSGNNGVAGTLAMTMANGKIKKKYGIVDERKELQLCLNDWVDALGDKQYLHGDKITLPDLMVLVYYEVSRVYPLTLR